MIKPDWNIFKAKFSENPQSNFEWLCYILFCKEYGKEFGVFRYKNQSGIETNPISVDKEVIGWQAKFYETTLSDHKGELITTLTKSKRDYPDINKIIFYTNQEWGQSHTSDKPEQNDPQAKIDIDTKASQLEIQVEWRTASFFESPFVTLENEYISKHFFSFKKDIFQLLSEKKLHTEAILESIQTSISYQDENLEINRSTLLQDILGQIEREQVLIVTGMGGVGKTAVIKKLYENVKEDTPFYIFKANEFEINNINNLFGVNGNSFNDFIDIHKEDARKLIVIDSAEKILDLEKTDPFNEFISTLIKHEWKVIFTARSNYLSDLDMQFIDHYKVKPFKFYIQELSIKELVEYAQEFDFNLPSDEKLIELLKNPFYLNEYLRFYDNEEVVDYLNFKEKLWNRLIKKSKPNREQCFMKIAFQRAKEGQFFISPTQDEETVSVLLQDGILGYEVAGYFITHDIYEEWALGKIIESEYIKRVSLQDFFKNIGESLPIRRSFRKWVSDKLLIEDNSVENLIEEVFETEDIPYFWKDEMLVSVLLSPYSDYFIKLFEKELLENDQQWLKRVTFLLRVACKEVDEDYLKLIGLDKHSISAMKYIVTKPKGHGWESVIKIIYKYKDSLDIETVNYILPVIYEWNNKFKNGEVTRLAALIALKYYEVIIEKDNYAFRGNDTEEKIIQTILYGAREISEELSEVFSEVIKNNWRKYRDPYYSLVNAILSRIGDNQEVLKILPSYVLQLAELYWIKPTEAAYPFYNSRLDLEDNFSIDKSNSDYYPSSAYQTPIYWLLKYSFKETVDFILRFVNKTVESYVDSDLAKGEVEEIEVNINDKVIKQYISNRLWNTYRGTQVSPKIFESIHMALEKFLLERGEHTDSEILENVSLYLIENSKSASITAIISSVILANHEKTFNIAKVLFNTKEFFFYDSSRRIIDQSAKSLFAMGYGLNYKHDIHIKERIQSCDDKHREKTLENVALMYQFFRNEETSDEEATKRMEALWAIFDEYYEELENPSLAENKTWRLFLARMDRRKMNPTVEKVDQGVQIDFNPKIDSELMEYSESALQKNSEATMYLPLKLWSDYKFKRDAKSSEYTKYEENPLLALKEIQEMFEGLQNGYDKDYIFAKGIPPYVCAVLLRDYFSLLSQTDKEFCKEVILTFSSSSLEDNYTYQIGDGMEAAISSLPVMLKYFPEDKEIIKGILLFTLFNDHPLGISIKFSDYSTKSILNELWAINYKDAQSLLLGYLSLKPKYEDMKERLRLESFERRMDVKENFSERFFEEYKANIEKVIKNEITLEEIGNINDIHPRILKTAFQLIPLETNNDVHKNLIQSIITIFADKLLWDDRANRMDYEVSHAFMVKLAEIILSSRSVDIPKYLEPFILKLNNSESLADLFKEFIYVEDRLKKYDNFWLVWELFYEKVVELNNIRKNSYINSRIIKSYLFADALWNENVSDWHTLNDQNKRFLMKVTREIGDSPAVLYSIAKLLNGIGQRFINPGISWISHMLLEHQSLWNIELEENTIYYLEIVIKSYIYINREKIRREARLKREVLIVLDFLVEKGSVAGYMLRESIL
ncbi:AVAST type 4 anti-phage nuclease Avs4 [Rossellomorea aquimaris]|uniref:ATPase family protein associated with various cellular activities (AAA) n=1 Tax=Rossellomorea aquimaris TaxID=189382 RepID=A0A366EFW5_9BACI|nr:AVAST type 4 anti-phage nuclease Avs4 [Rossellomorea aquimaris]RBP01223.1 ATPase family protein associated with various cellular activities (AAA) [Rossellomorea aquimaris]